ncbi:unnamed protein product [Penicillium roqueforti FM164]|uniref:Genomic scaffold, ProqFM164S01 n=1 Tax=Penicillium roqueforti (strain FM164) TaxID=1365484 RepID=W6PZ07_PENRF|nr:unnamed protein product [Penicillium roqueforti FM164]
MPQTFDPDLISRKGSPPSLFKEILFLSVSSVIGNAARFKRAVAQYMPSKLQLDFFVFDELYISFLFLRARFGDIGLRHNAQDPLIFGVKGLCDVQDLLDMIIGPCTDDSQDDAPGAFHVLFRQARDLDFEDIVAKSNARRIGAGKAHAFLRFFDQCGEVPTRGKGLGGEGSKLLSFLLILPRIPRLDGYFNPVVRASAKNNFGREPRADIALGWKAHSGDGLQYRAFSTGLIAADDDLRQLHKASNSDGAQLVNLVQQF